MASLERRPVLVVPGFASSGLRCERSLVAPSWKGERIWVSVNKLVTSTITKPSATTSARRRRQSHSFQDKDGNAPSAISPPVTSDHKWIRHMLLAEDGYSDREGICVRAIDGVEGIDYLVEGALKSTSAVFAPCIKALKKLGYVAGKDLDAAPYDWRIAPRFLEERDGYFTALESRIETMYSKHCIAVVLLAHSMGVRVVQYFLQRQLERRGQAWVDKHIWSFLPVGGPFLGAPSIYRAMLSGASFSTAFDTFLSARERLLMERSPSSMAWLMPVGELRRQSCCHLRTQSVLRVELMSLRVRRSCIRSDHAMLYVEIKCNSGQGAAVGDSDRGHDGQHRHLPNVGVLGSSMFKHSNGVKERSCDLRWGEVDVPLGVRVQFVAHSSYQLTKHDTVRVQVHEYTTTLAGAASTTRLVGARYLDLRTCVTPESPYFEGWVPCTEGKERTVKNDSDVQIKMGVRWVPATSVIGDDDGIGGVAVDADASAIGSSVSGRRPKSQASASLDYVPVNVEKLLQQEGVGNQVEFLHRYYYADPYFGSSDAGPCLGPPPVARVYHIHGVGVDTERRYFYRRREYAPSKNDDGAELSIELDKDAQLRSLDEVLFQEKIEELRKLGDADGELQMHLQRHVRRGRSVSSFSRHFRHHHHSIPVNNGSPTSVKSDFKLAGGIAFETSQTQQTRPDTGEHVRACGDGTVPWSSLQHPTKWPSQREMLVQTLEMEGAEHRDMLALPEFHRALSDYLCNVLVVRVVGARNVRGMNTLTHSLDVYCVVTPYDLRGERISAEKGSTRVEYRTLSPQWDAEIRFGSKVSVHQYSKLHFEIFAEDDLAHELLGTVDVNLAPPERRSPMISSRSPSVTNSGVGGSTGSRPRHNSISARMRNLVRSQSSEPQDCVPSIGKKGLKSSPNLSKSYHRRTRSNNASLRFSGLNNSPQRSSSFASKGTEISEGECCTDLVSGSGGASSSIHQHSTKSAQTFQNSQLSSTAAASPFSPQPRHFERGVQNLALETFNTEKVTGTPASSTSSLSNDASCGHGEMDPGLAGYVEPTTVPMFCARPILLLQGKRESLGGIVVSNSPTGSPKISSQRHAKHRSLGLHTLTHLGGVSRRLSAAKHGPTGRTGDNGQIGNVEKASILEDATESTDSNDEGFQADVSDEHIKSPSSKLSGTQESIPKSSSSPQIRRGKEYQGQLRFVLWIEPPGVSTRGRTAGASIKPPTVSHGDSAVTDPAASQHETDRSSSHQSLDSVASVASAGSRIRAWIHGSSSGSAEKLASSSGSGGSCEIAMQSSTTKLMLHAGSQSSGSSNLENDLPDRSRSAKINYGVINEGILLKKGRGRNVHHLSGTRNFKKRWFVLQGGELRWFKASVAASAHGTMGAHALGHLLLTHHHQATPMHDFKRAALFKVEPRKAAENSEDEEELAALVADKLQQVTLQADSEEEMHMWVNTISEEVARIKERRRRPSNHDIERTKLLSAKSFRDLLGDSTADSLQWRSPRSKDNDGYVKPVSSLKDYSTSAPRYSDNQVSVNQGKQRRTSNVTFDVDSSSSEGDTNVRRISNLSAEFAAANSEMSMDEQRDKMRCIALIHACRDVLNEQDEALHTMKRGSGIEVVLEKQLESLQSNLKQFQASKSS